MDQKKQFSELSRASLSYQVIKYILLVLNIMIVTTTAIVTIIVCLLPTIIYEKKLVIENAISFFESGNFFASQIKHDQQQRSNSEQYENKLVHLSSQEIETIRLIRYIILGLSAFIILNQTLAVYGLFKERTCHILISSTFIGLIGQLSLFVLPASAFLLVILYLICSICYVVLLNQLEFIAKKPAWQTRSASRASSMEPSICQSKSVCCCRCKACLCNNSMSGGNTVTATIHPSRKASIQSQPYQSAPYYYGSLGRRSREPSAHRPMLSQLQNPKLDIYNTPNTQRQNYNISSLKPSNKFSNLAMDNSQNIYSNSRRDVPAGYNYAAALERTNNSTVI